MHGTENIRKAANDAHCIYQCSIDSATSDATSPAVDESKSACCAHAAATIEEQLEDIERRGEASTCGTAIGTLQRLDHEREREDSSSSHAIRLSAADTLTPPVYVWPWEALLFLLDP